MRLYVKSTVCIFLFITLSSSGREARTKNLIEDGRKLSANAADTMMAPTGGWDHLLIATPHTIAILGQLMLLSTHNDFTMVGKTARKSEFKFLKYPDSFRASLVQLANMGWEAFNDAHISMDSTKLHTTNIDKYIQNIVYIMTKGTPDEIEIIVPMTLKKIERIADECVSLSEKAEAKFIHFMEAIGELLEASTSAKAMYDEKEKETVLAIDAAKNERKLAEEEKAELEVHFQNIQIEVKNAKDEFQAALNSTPSTLKLFGLSILDGFSNVIKTFIPGVASPVHEILKEYETPESDEDRARKHAYKFAKEIDRNIQTLVDVATSGKEKGQKTPNWNEIEQVRVAKHTFRTILKSLRRHSLQTDAHEDGIQLCEKAIHMCERLLEYHKEMTPQKNEIDSLIMEIEDLQQDIQQYLSASETFAFKGSAFKTFKSSSSFVENELLHAQLNVEVSGDILKESRKRQENLYRDIQKTKARMKEALEELAKFRIEHVEFDKIRKVLKDGLQEIQAVRKQWGKIVRFFQNISRIIKMKLHTSVKDFIDMADVGSQQLIKHEKLSDVTRNLLFEEVIQVSTMTYAVQGISSLYVEISEKYLIDQINSLSGLAALDPEMDQIKIQAKQKELLENCQEAQEEISVIATAKREDYRKKTADKITQLATVKK